MLKKVIIVIGSAVAGAVAAGSFYINGEIAKNTVDEVKENKAKAAFRETRKEKVPGKFRKQFVTRDGFGNIVDD
jgi:uncharacterized protein (DUF697 family)